MEYKTPKLSGPLKYHGGKYYLAKDIIPLFPECDIFVDATVGAGNIILHTESKPGRMRYAIDIDNDIITMWSILQNPRFNTKEILQKSNYDEITFNLSKMNDERDKSLNPGLWAAKYIINNRFSRGGLRKNFAWSERLRGGKPGDVNAWENFVNYDYDEIVKRIRDIRFINGCMRTALTKLNILQNPNAVVYIDPPYVHSSRTIKNVYKYEMKTYDKEVEDPEKTLTHEGIWRMIREAKCRFFVSGYYSKVYEEFGAKIIFSKDIANHSGQNKTKERRSELVYSLV